MTNIDYQLHHFARAFHKWPWEVPDDASLVLPHMAIMAADSRGQAKAVKLAQRRGRAGRG